MADFDGRIAEIEIDGRQMKITTHSGHVVELLSQHVYDFCRQLQKEGTTVTKAKMSFKHRECKGCGDR